MYMSCLTQKAPFHCLKSVNFSCFRVTLTMLHETVPAQPLPLRNIDISIIMLFNKHENNRINKVSPYPIS